MSFITLDEISSQPECWQRAGDLAGEVAGLLPRPGERVAYVGAGTAWYMAECMAALREAAGQGESDAFAASEVPPGRAYDRLVVLTRSGRTTDVNRVLAAAAGKVPTLCFVGEPDSESAVLADAVIDLSFADEVSVVQTRFATTVLALTRAWLGDSTERLVDQAEQALQFRLTDEHVDTEQITFLGYRWTVGLAREAAAKFRQCTQSWAEAYPIREYRHGPIAVAEPGRIVWMLGPTPTRLADQVRESGATLIEQTHDPMAELIVAQRLAVARAMKLGLNPDEPRNLTRTVEQND